MTFNFDAWFQKIIEDISVDPNTLTSMIINKRIKGYVWPEQVRNNTPQIDVYKLNPKIAFDFGRFFIESIEEAKKEKKASKKETTKEEPKQEQQIPPPETNQRDPNMMSTDPNFNPCPAYLMGVCRVDGRPCPFSILDYKECGKYFLASTGDPNLMDVPVGREQDPAYAQGRNA